MSSEEQRPSGGAASEFAIELRKINKRFGPVWANRDIDLGVRRGTIHGIVGENGAGKSTLMSILYGFYTADSGEIFVNGKREHITDSRHALALGIGMVHQHFMLVDNFSILENVLLGAEDSALLAPSLARARKELKRLADEYSLDVNPDAIVEDVSVGQQQRVEILKALYRGADTLILDEPTGVLTPEEADDLFRVLRVLRDQGKTVILITHKLREIMAITDTVSVMRQGQMVVTMPTVETSPEKLAEAMVGRRVLLRVEKGVAHPGKPLLEVQSLVVRDDLGVERVKGVSFNVRAGEIVGIAGVAGNGQSELLESIAGMRDQRAGQVLVSGAPLSLKGDDGAARARVAGLAHVPEDRQREGLVIQFEEWENSILGYQDDAAYGNGVFLDIAAARREAVERMQKFDVRPANPRLRTASFSGGNQQKIVLAREMEHDPDVLIVGQPTRGVDIGAIEFIHNQIVKMRDAGKAILLVSVELDEIRSLSDRILVMFDGHIVGEADPATATEGELGLMMAGVPPEEAAGARVSADIEAAGGVTMSARRPLPRWADVALLPVLNLVLAMIVSGIVIAAIGQNPLDAIRIMSYGAFGYGEGIGFTLHFATDFVFTGLAVAVAAHAGLFNIGGEGQAYLGGLGAIAVGLWLDHTSWLLVLPLAIIASGLVGGLWALIPGYLQAKRGSHVVITTIMFNFIASAIMVYLLNYVLKPMGVQEPSTANVVAAGKIPQLRQFFPIFGYAPLNMTIIFAILALIFVYVLLWHTKLGYAMRTMGHNPAASLYAGISNSKLTMIVMFISGGLAGMVAVNEVLGEQARIVIDYTSGYGFVGIAVALMGRNHPVGIALAAILFGALYQGGLELQFEMPAVTRDMIVVIQALVIMFTGAMEGLLRPGLENAFMVLGPRQKAEAVARETVGTEG